MENVSRLFDIPYYQQKNFPKKDAFTAKINGKWEPMSIDTFLEKANSFSRALLAKGVKPGDKVALISNNRPEWNIADIGILQIGAINVPVYPTISENDYKFIFNDAEVKLCFVSDEELFTKVSHIKNEVPTLQNIYTFEQVNGAENWSEFLKEDQPDKGEEVEKIKASIKEDDLATLIYTSGTTGLPKGVMLSHKNIVSNCLACIDRLPVDENGKSLTFLPVCHVYERMLQYLYMVTGVSIYYAESMDTIGDNIREVQPDVFTAVPRLIEKVYDKIMAKGQELTGIKKKLFYWAVSVGEQYEVPEKGGWYKFKLKIARKLIFSKWQEALGGNVKAIASGSAALQPRLARIFNAADIPLMEGYGLTETSPVVSVNYAENDGLRFGTVGTVIDGVTVKIAEDGEILVKGPNVMLGYYKREDLTKEVIDEEGWFHTGDIGTWVEDRFLKITDRKKEIFKTSGGKYIAPQVMENKFKESNFIEQLMVIGEGQKHPSALIVPAYDFIFEWAKKKGIPVTSREEALANEKVIARIQKDIDELNTNFGSWEQVKKPQFLLNDWGIETGELTPTLKLKRKVIMEKFKNVVDKVYNS